MLLLVQSAYIYQNKKPSLNLTNEGLAALGEINLYHSDINARILIEQFYP